MISYNLKHHYRPRKGWMNDPNGLVYFRGEYHIFYQHCPDCEKPFTKQPMHWGHARTKDFINWEELPVALTPNMPYDNNGCWSGTAIVKDDILYLFYASITGDEYSNQTVSIAYSKDGINFEKYEKNPVIGCYPKDATKDFRAPAVFEAYGKYFCVMATGKDGHGRILLYESENLLDWLYSGILLEDERPSKIFECPILRQYKDKWILACSLITQEEECDFAVYYGDFDGKKFHPQFRSRLEYGPDQYASQTFVDNKGRLIEITWLPGWKYSNYGERSLGCLSLPREITVRNGRIYGFPVEEVQHLLKDSDPIIQMTDSGFKIDRKNGTTVEHKGKIEDIKILRDEYILEIFVNKGENIYCLLIEE